MTTVNPNRPTTTATTPSTTPTVDGANIEALPSPAPSAATFEAPSKTRAAPFGPPHSPSLTYERTATSSLDRERIRDENGERIKAYNKQYATYLETYKAAVESAPDLERVQLFRAPVSYDPDGSLPVDERAGYGELHKPALANQKIVHEAIGERVLKERGERVPGFYGFFEGKVGMFGQTAKERFELSQDGIKAKTTLGYSVSSPVVTPVGKPKVSVSIDPDSGKAKGAVSTKIGGAAFVGIELDTAAKLTVDFGVRKEQQLLGTKGELSVAVGSSWDPASARAEAFVKTGAKVGDFDVEVKAGVGTQLLTKEYVAEVINPHAKSFFDDDRINALRSGGR
jgi:hypothetical protein